MSAADSPPFTTDQIALAVEIPGLYDGTAVYLLKDGTLVNRFRQDPDYWPAHRISAADKWIADHGDALRTANADLLETP